MMAGRVRTEVRLKPEVREVLEGLADVLDVNMGVVVTLALGHYTVFVRPLLLESPKKKDLVSKIRTEFLEICDGLDDES